MDNRIILGYSGHAYVVIDAMLKCGHSILGYCDISVADRNPYQLEYLGYEFSHDFSYWGYSHKFVMGIGSNTIRRKLFLHLKDKQEYIDTVIHPSSEIASKVRIQEGCFIGAHATISPLVDIGAASIINTGAIIEHECKIGGYSHIAPGAVLAGNVSIGHESFIGANAVVKEGVTIGDGVIVGAGAVVLSDISAQQKYVGNPAKPI